jgi:hypothetical protein
MVLVDPPHDDPVATLSDELPGGDDDPVAFLNLDDPVRAVVVLRVGGFLRFLVAREMADGPRGTILASCWRQS